MKRGLNFFVFRKKKIRGNIPKKLFLVDSESIFIWFWQEGGGFSCNLTFFSFLLIYNFAANPPNEPLKNASPEVGNIGVDIIYNSTSEEGTFIAAVH